MSALEKEISLVGADAEMQNSAKCSAKDVVCFRSHSNAELLPV